MKASAKIAFTLPQSRRSGARMNSITFINAMTEIWVIALSRGQKRLRNHTVIAISAIPISVVSMGAYSSPRILATICR